MKKREKLLILEKQLKNQLIVSCQALPGEPLYLENDTIMPLMAKAAVQAGAKGIRANGSRDIKAIKKVVDVPIIGIVKKHYEGGNQYITVTMKEVDELVEAGTDIIALDCTLQDRFDGKTINEFVKEIKEKYEDIVLMADIASFEDAKNAEIMGIDFIGTTLNGYTEYTKGSTTNIPLIEKLSKELKTPIIGEGKIHTPEQAKEAIDKGAFAVVVGGAITRPLEITQRFLKGMGL